LDKHDVQLVRELHVKQGDVQFLQV